MLEMHQVHSFRPQGERLHRGTTRAAAALLMILLCAASICPVSVFADLPGRVVLPNAKGEAVELYQSSHALLIGISRYTAGWPSLESIPGELDEVRDALIGHGFEVDMVADADAEGLEDAFRGFIDAHGYDPGKRLFVLYAGHGYTRQGNKGYLVPADAPDPTKDEKGFVRKALSMTQVLTWAREIEAKHVLFLFDSCFSGTIFKTRELPKVPAHIEARAAHPVRQFITAGSAEQPVPAKSVFTPSFVRALKGDGDINRDGFITGQELGNYLFEKVSSYGSQRPQYGKIRDPELDEGDFVFQVQGYVPPSPSQLPAPPSAVAESVSLSAGQTAELEGLLRGFYRDGVMTKEESLGVESFARRYGISPGVVSAHVLEVQPHIQGAGRSLRDGADLARAGKLDAAREEIERASRYDPKDPQAWANLGAVDLDLGNMVSAESSLRRALALAPDLWIARINLAQVLAGRGAMDGALTELRRAFADAPAARHAALRQHLSGDPGWQAARKDPDFVRWLEESGE